MKLTTRSNHIKHHVPIPEIAIVNPPILQNNIDYIDPQHLLAASHHHQNYIDQFLKPDIQSPFDRINSLKDKSMTTRIDSNNIYDSVKNQMACSNLTDWKILTLQQLRKKGKLSTAEKLQRKRNRSHGIQVSISQTKNTQKSREKLNQQSQKKQGYTEKTPYFKRLSSLKKKGQLLDRLQYHLNKNQQDAHFC